MASPSRLSRFISLSALLHLALLLLFAGWFRQKPVSFPLFTEVTVMGVVPRGVNDIEKGLDRQKAPANHAKATSSIKIGALPQKAKAKRSMRSSAVKLNNKRLSKKEVLKKRIEEAETRSREAPIGLQAVGSSNPDLASPGDGGAVPAYGLPNGTDIQGPIAQRKVRFSHRPDYPDWAKKQGIDATVTLDVGVEPDGTINHAIRISKTSGYRELDQLALQSMLQWVFEALPLDARQDEQWGTVTFTFSVK